MTGGSARRRRRLVFVRSVKAADVAGAFSERLQPKLGKENAALKAFQKLFSAAEFSNGAVVTMSANRGKLCVGIGGKQVGTIDSAPLVRALFDIYLGKDPVSPSAKRDFGARVAAAAAAAK